MQEAVALMHLSYSMVDKLPRSYKLIKTPWSLPNMTSQTILRSSAILNRRRQAALKLALCAAPIVGAFCFSPAEASGLTVKTFSGFVDPVQPASWTASGTGSGSIGFRYIGGSTVQVMNLTADAGQNMTYSLNTNVFNAFAPISSTPGKYFTFDSGVLKFASSLAGSSYSFNPSTSPQNLAPNQVFKFELTSIVGTSDANITDLQVDASYREVPGPLPVAAALGAFAWSRRIRRRLSAASQA
jgi:hypothetical protein